MSKPPVACLNEVLLRAALRAERANEARLLDGEASQLARRNDNHASLYHRVPVTQTESANGYNSQSVDI
jgi:hypothetical protein